MPKRDDLIEFTTPTDPELSIIDGRNGMFHITQLHVWESHDHVHVYLDGIGKRGLGIHGGLRVTKECFANACRTFLDEYGNQMRAKNVGRKHTDNCGRTGRPAVVMNCKMDCGCWCHQPTDCAIDTEGFCQICQKVHLRERAAVMEVPAGEKEES